MTEGITTAMTSAATIRKNCPPRRSILRVDYA